MGEVIQLQGDQRKDVQEFLTDKKEGLDLDAKTIKVKSIVPFSQPYTDIRQGPWLLNPSSCPVRSAIIARILDRSA
jgi:hypothetical protein